MTRLRRIAVTVAAGPLALLGACHSDRQPGATTPAEDRQLDEAAAMQDANSMEVNAVVANGSSGASDDNGKTE